jgi:hypothetical protein
MVCASVLNHDFGLLKTRADEFFGRDIFKKPEIGRLGAGINEEWVEGSFNTS